MLLIMLPLIVFASTQHDFLRMYPKMKEIAFSQHTSPHGSITFYISLYGIDFITIEIFFRGFLVIICSLCRYRSHIADGGFLLQHSFGKPLLECISSFFGGILLGIITYNTQTILGGLMVHWELPGWRSGGYWEIFSGYAGRTPLGWNLSLKLGLEKSTE
jgi:hypothetical protein